MVTRWTARPEWQEQRRCYGVLHAVHSATGGNCTDRVSAAQIGTRLGLEYGPLLQVLGLLQQHGYLSPAEDGLGFCITPRGAEYISSGAGRRRSLRLPTRPANRSLL